MKNRNSMKKVLACAVSATMILGMASPAVFAEEETEAEVAEEAMAEGTAIASGEKWTATETEDGWIKVENDGGETLGYSPDSGVTLIEDDGYAFKDLDKDGELDVYEDWRLTDEERANDLVSQMSIEQMTGLRFNAGLSTLGSDDTDAVFMDGQFTEDGVTLETAITDYGFRYCISYPVAYHQVGFGEAASFANRENALAESTEFGIPMAINADPNMKYQASMSNMAMAATFDTDMVTEITQETSKLMRSIGITISLGPHVDVLSDPRVEPFVPFPSITGLDGVISGNFSEDPALARDMANAYISGMQSTYDENGEDLGWGDDSVVNMMKHFAGNYSTEFGRDYHSGEGGWSVFPGDSFETQLIPYIDGGLNLDSSTEKVGAVMLTYTAAYSEDGEYGNVAGAANSFLTDTLKKYGFEGLISTDGLSLGALTGVDTSEMTVADEVSVMFEAGVHQIMGTDYSVVHGIEAYDILAEEYGEEYATQNYQDAAYAALIPMFRVGSFENPYVSVAYAEELESSSPNTNSDVNEYNQKSIVMLKNDGIIAEKTDEEKQTVYVPMIYSAMNGTWDFPVSEEGLSEYYNFVTDTVGEPSGPEGRYMEDDIIRASEEEIAACDFSLVIITSPLVGSAYDSETDTWLPISIQYEDYTADSEYVRTESISGEVIETVVESPYGDIVTEEKENTAYYGQSTSTSNISDLNVVTWVAENTDIPMVICINAHGQMVISEIEGYADAIFMGFNVLNYDNFLPLVAGEVEPSALLPIEVPASMEAVEAQLEDVPRDEECYVDANGNTYDFAFGLNWSGVIDDERVAEYKVDPLTELSTQPVE